MNFKNMYKSNLKCDTSTDENETQEHVMVCLRWEGERRGLDLVKFFTKILKEK